MKIKVCGLTHPENIAKLLELNIDYIGLVFAPKSPRRVKRKSGLADWIRENEELFGTTKRVGVFVNAEMDELLNAVHDYQLDYVQLHGDESPGYCRELSLLWSVSTLRKAEISKAFPITADFDFSLTAAYAESCAHFVFDTGGQAQAGGTGKRWNWDLLATYKGFTPFLLSGGIGPEDAGQVRAIAHPQLLGVDVNSRFETEPGRKDVNALREFAKELRA